MYILNRLSSSKKQGHQELDTNGRVFSGPFNERGTEDVACIHHYFLKSEGEFREKGGSWACRHIYKKNVKSTGGNRHEEDFSLHDLNEIHDSRAWDLNLLGAIDMIVRAHCGRNHGEEPSTDAKEPTRE